MKQKHLYSLLDQSYTTIKVVFTQEQVSAPRAPQAPRQARDAASEAATRASIPWAMPEQTYHGKAYTYKVARDVEVKVDDFVVVYSDARGLVIARVVEVHETPQIDVDASFDYKWIVQRIDREAYQRRVDAERVFSDSMLQVERVRQRESMLRGFHENLPEGSEARRLFDSTIQALQAPTVDHAPPAAPAA